MINEMTIDSCIKNLTNFTNNSKYASLSGKSILLLTFVSDDTADTIVAAGVRKITRLPKSDGKPSLETLCQKIQEFAKKQFDSIFMDIQEIDDIDFGKHSTTLFALLRNMLSPEGAMFFTLKVGQNDRNFDVQNTCVLSDGTWLPGRAYLFDNVLKDWAVRTMKTAVNIAPQTDILLLRLVPKKQSILLICGKSMSGKTTLARELTFLNPYIHVSNDFIYMQLVRMLKNNDSKVLDPMLINYLGDGSGQACGNFNRALESVPGLLDLYMPYLLESIPKSISLVSIDFDLRLHENIHKLYTLLTDRGFSVWLVQRSSKSNLRENFY